MDVAAHRSCYVVDEDARCALHIARLRRSGTALAAHECRAAQAARPCAEVVIPTGIVPGLSPTTPSQPHSMRRCTRLGRLGTWPLAPTPRRRARIASSRPAEAASAESSAPQAMSIKLRPRRPVAQRGEVAQVVGRVGHRAEQGSEPRTALPAALLQRRQHREHHQSHAVEQVERQRRRPARRLEQQRAELRAVVRAHQHTQPHGIDRHEAGQRAQVADQCASHAVLSP